MIYDIYVYIYIYYIYTYIPCVRTHAGQPQPRGFGDTGRRSCPRSACGGQASQRASTLPAAALSLSLSLSRSLSLVLSLDVYVYDIMYVWMDAFIYVYAHTHTHSGGRGERTSRWRSMSRRSQPRLTPRRSTSSSSCRRPT